MKTNRNLIPIWLLCCTMLPTVAQAQFDYTTDNGAITITDYTGPGGVVAIPSSINVAGTNLPVTTIGDHAFDGHYSLTSITIPAGVTTIGSCAFSECGRLTSVIIPDSVNSIGDDAFLDCASLASATIPNGVQSIADYSFSGCSSLTNVVISDNVTNIGFGAFDGCTSLASATIPGSVTSIGGNAFDYCLSLTSIAVPASVTSIGYGAFGSCGHLAAITVNSSNLAYSSVDGVLFNLNRTALIQYPGGKAGTYTVPTGVTSILLGAFSYVAGLTNATIPDTVTSIGDDAFGYCTGLGSLTIGNKVANIGDYAVRELPQPESSLFQRHCPQPRASFVCIRHQRQRDRLLPGRNDGLGCDVLWSSRRAVEPTGAGQRRQLWDADEPVWLYNHWHCRHSHHRGGLHEPGRRQLDSAPDLLRDQRLHLFL